MGTDAIPPRAGGLPARLVLGPALRAQPDGRLVRLVREGYEGAFEEIVRRYRRPLGRFAASIVGGRGEDVTQDSFRKALEALRGGEAEIELRPWLYRIVRNTALNDLRDRPPAAAELAEHLIAGSRSAAAEAEEREEVADLIERLRALPGNQRAALLMRELDGMGHEEIATALGISKGAARQSIARARAAVRTGFGALVPLPILRSLLEGAAPVEAGLGAGAASGAAGAAIASGGAGAGALKIGLATVVVAGGLGAGVAIDHHRHATRPPATSHPAAPALARPEAFALPRSRDGEPRTPSVDSDRDVADDDHGDDDRGERAATTTESAPDDNRGGDDHDSSRSGSNHGSSNSSSGSGHGSDKGGPGPSEPAPVTDDSSGSDGGHGSSGGSGHSDGSESHS